MCSQGANPSRSSAACSERVPVRPSPAPMTSRVGDGTPVATPSSMIDTIVHGNPSSKPAMDDRATHDRIECHPRQRPVTPQPLRGSDQSTSSLYARQHGHAPAHLHYRRARRRRLRRAGRDQIDHHSVAATARALHLLQRHAGRPGARDDRDDDHLHLRCLGDPTASGPQVMSSPEPQLCSGAGNGRNSINSRESHR
jgi:hypothetical protein